MVGQTNHRGLHEWLAQRVTALIIGLYALFILAYILFSNAINYHQWHGLFDHFVMKLFTLLVLFSVIWHAWIGIWTVFTDYVKIRPIRIILEAIVILFFVVLLVCTIALLWG